MSEQSVPQLEEIEAMFVQCAHGMTTSDGTITFQGPAHSTLFFADRPQRVVGHMQTRKFVDEWGYGENSFAEDPPNAVVSFLEEGDTVPEEVTVELREALLQKILRHEHAERMYGRSSICERKRCISCMFYGKNGEKHLSF